MRRQPSFESLETRRLFAELAIFGTGGPDHVTLWVEGPDYVVDVNFAISRHPIATTDTITISTFGGDDNINVRDTHDPITVNAGADDDTMRLATVDLSSVSSDVTFNGGAGADAAVLNDHAWSLGATYLVTDTLTTWDGPGRLLRSDIESLTLNAGSGRDTIDVRTAAALGTNVTLNAGASDDFILIQESGLGTATTIDTGPGADIVQVNPDNTGFAAAVFNSAQEIGSLSIGAGGRVALSPGGLSPLRTQSLVTDLNGTLNITDNAVVVDYAGASPIAEIHWSIARGYNGGNWLGAGGITSSAAVATPGTGVGYAEAVDVFAALPATFGGMTVDATSVLIRHTRYGDVNLDGRVNLADFNRLAAHFGHGLRFWAHGNLDYDVDVDLADFNRLAANFGASIAGPEGVEEELPQI